MPACQRVRHHSIISFTLLDVSLRRISASVEAGDTIRLALTGQFREPTQVPALIILGTAILMHFAANCCRKGSTSPEPINRLHRGRRRTKNIQGLAAAIPFRKLLRLLPLLDLSQLLHSCPLQRLQRLANYVRHHSSYQSPNGPGRDIHKTP